MAHLWVIEFKYQGRRWKPVVGHAFPSRNAARSKRIHLLADVKKSINGADFKYRITKYVPFVDWD